MVWPFRKKTGNGKDSDKGKPRRRRRTNLTPKQQEQADALANWGKPSSVDNTPPPNPNESIPLEPDKKPVYQAPQPPATVQLVEAPPPVETLQPAFVPKKITSTYLLETYLPDKLMANRTAFDMFPDEAYTSPNSRCYISVRDDALILVSLKHKRASVVFGFQTEYDCKDNKYAGITERVLPRVKETGLEPELDTWGTIDDKTVFTLGLPFELKIKSIGDAVDKILMSYNGTGLLDLPEGELIKKMGTAIGQAEPPQVITGTEAMNLYNQLLQQ